MRLEEICTVSHSGDVINRDYRAADDISGIMLVSTANLDGAATATRFGCLAQLRIRIGSIPILDVQSTENTWNYELSAVAQEGRYNDQAANEQLAGTCFIPLGIKAGKTLSTRVATLAAAKCDEGEIKVYAVYDGPVSSERRVVRREMALADASFCEIDQQGELDAIIVIGAAPTETFKMVLNGYTLMDPIDIAAFIQPTVYSVAAGEEILPRYIIPINQMIGDNSRIIRDTVSTKIWTMFESFVNGNPTGSENSAADAGSFATKQNGLQEQVGRGMSAPVSLNSTRPQLRQKQFKPASFGRKKPLNLFR